MPLPTRVDFAYAFAAPHRLTVALPDSSDKTLCDCTPDALRLAWTTDDLRHTPRMAYVWPATQWELFLRADVDGAACADGTWTRADGWLPVLEATYHAPAGAVAFAVAGGAEAALVRVTLHNPDAVLHTFGLTTTVGGAWAGYLPAWVNPSWDRDVLLAGWKDRADRALLLGLDADAYAVQGPTTIRMTWQVPADATRTAWLLRPYRGYAADLPALRATDCAAAFTDALAPWQALRARAARVLVPDAGVTDAFYACLADQFIMREPVADGYLGVTPGTEMYRAANPVEPMLTSIAQDQLGLADEAAKGIAVCLETQGDDGDWNDPQGWAHLFWGSAGFKAWGAMTHYHVTGDRDFLARVYPRMAAQTRWAEGMRAATRVPNADGTRPAVYGLMPRGMGDAGLMDDDDLYGVFLPHNIWAVYCDRLTVEAAKLLGKTDDLPALRRIADTATADLLAALEAGAIQEDGYRWIPAVAGKTCGSRWGALNAAFPCGLLPADHPLITGTIRKIEARMSPGGVPVHTGWMVDGMWVAITLDNLAEVLLLRDEGDAAAAYLYATLNHATPLVTWCEERGQAAGTTECNGDRQHLWTPAAVLRFLRDALVLEDGDTLHLARGIDRAWLGSGEPVGLEGGGCRYGAVDYRVTYDPAARRLTGYVTVARPAPRVTLHARLPHGLRLAPAPGVAPDGATATWHDVAGRLHIDLAVTG